MSEIRNVAGLLTENGNIKTEVRNTYKEQVADRYLGSFTQMPNGEYVMELVESDGKVIKAVVSLAISTRDNFEKKTSKPRAKEVEALEIPDLFE